MSKPSNNTEAGLAASNAGSSRIDLYNIRVSANYTRRAQIRLESPS